MDKLRSPSPLRRRLLSVASSIAFTALLLAGCSNETAAKEPTANPTPDQILANPERDVIAVAVFPLEAEGLDGAHRYCRDLGRKVLGVSDDREAVTCDLPGAAVDVPKGDDNPENDDPMIVACETLGGIIEGVPAPEDPKYNYPACVVEG